MSASLPAFLKPYDAKSLGVDIPDLEWFISEDKVHYPDALAFMEGRAAEIHEETAKQAIWYLEHPPLYTAGTSANPNDLLAPDRFPVYDAGRGGQYTYHGPGQRVVYVMLDIKRFGSDVRKFVHSLEDWSIKALADCGVTADVRDGRVGLWVEREKGILHWEDKVGAIGVRVRRWVSFHGLAFNINPDLSHFTGIVPCGITQHGVTSFEDLGVAATMSDFDAAMTRRFADIFEP